jgi:hypothetical protein
MTLNTQPATPVSIAEDILELAKLAFASLTNSDNAVTDTFVLYNAKNRMQDLCNKLLQGVLGRLEYTVLLAGTTDKPTHLHSR